MAKLKVAPAPAAPQEPAPRTAPLSDITITWPPLRDFEGAPAATEAAAAEKKERGREARREIGEHLAFIEAELLGAP